MAKAKAKKNEGGITETIKTIVWALLIAGVFRTLFFQPFWIPSGSMKDTLLVGDFLFVNKMAYGYSRYSCPFSSPTFSPCPIEGRLFSSEPERGDVVVFRHPTQNVDFIKRLIGLPGDRIQMINGVLNINGEPVQLQDRPPFEEVKEPQGPQGLTPRCANDPVGFGGICLKGRQTETLPGNAPGEPGRSHDILNISDNWIVDNTPVFTVPEGQYFFMGDNRDDSEDSRFPQSAGGLGFVPKEYLVGRADRVIFSSAGRSLFYFWTWRADRFFKAVD
ncbi:signal peptidase I [Paenirhodobacter populi]|uniref:Signal peptidase I n=1 Tax=Paenirhodobacter populi TaxID=2306993 RepID=A0A443JHB4_9RHOB|nr:signal peptidase I [Sinirhodobacter populi]RWR11528.1 signal peptidase I [Sinirhodobacter populi]RWR13762.1 signal peptidase I [Sinirhodobacter populi]RWR19851.1 signal peptidase I [Sinirhodobacter populi]